MSAADTLNRFCQNIRTGKMHYSRDGETLVCVHKVPLAAAWAPRISGIYDWCVGCHSAFVDDKRRDRES